MQQLVEFYGNHPILGTAWLIFAVLMIVSLLQTAFSSSKALTPLLVTQMMNKQDAQVIDLRAIGDFNKGHIPNSRNIPFSKLKDSVKDLEKYKQSPMIMVCANGMQSSPAALLLKKSGFEQVHKLKGGLPSWTAENLPLAKG